MNIFSATDEMQDEAYEYMAARSKPGPLLICSFFAVFLAISPIYTDQPFEITVVAIALILISVIRIYNEFFFNKLYTLNKSIWKKIYVSTISINAFIWGMFCLIIVAEYGIHWVSLLILICTAGLSAGGIIAVIPHQMLSFSFQAFILLPTALYSFTLDNAAAYSVSYMFLCYLVFMTVMSNKLHVEYWTSVKNVRLLDQRAKELEIARDEAIALANTKSEFLATMSHELRTPMNGILGMTQLLEISNTNSEQNEYIKTIKDSTNLLLNLINDILDFSKVDAGKLTLELSHFNIKNMANDIYALLLPSADDKNLQLKLEIEEDLSLDYIGDCGRLRQVIVNLVGNAIKFTEKGSVTIKIESVNDSSNNNLKISVIDTGIGIPEQKQENIFAEFTQVDASSTRKYGGTGLGLSISEKIVKLMDGQIGFESKENSGSTFWFVIALQALGKNQIDAEENSDELVEAHAQLLIDPDRINQLKQIMEDQFPQLVETHLNSVDDNLQQIKGFMDDNNYENTLTALQGLASSSTSIGASLFEAEINCLITTISKDSRTLHEDEYQKLRQIASEVQQELHKLV